MGDFEERLVALGLPVDTAWEGLLVLAESQKSTLQAVKALLGPRHDGLATPTQIVKDIEALLSQQEVDEDAP